MVKAPESLRYTCLFLSRFAVTSGTQPAYCQLGRGNSSCVKWPEHEAAESG